MKKLLVQQHRGVKTFWLLTLYTEKPWWSKRVASAQFQLHNKKTAMKKATDLIELYGKLEVEVS